MENVNITVGGLTLIVNGDLTQGGGYMDSLYVEQALTLNVNGSIELNSLDNSFSTLNVISVGDVYIEGGNFGDLSLQNVSTNGGEFNLVFSGNINVEGTISTLGGELNIEARSYDSEGLVRTDVNILSTATIQTGVA
ncbi:MAG: hypothetical protein HC904_10230 [Blastochloris sp.]|nr:hypothetical protein [Blastochloris sp.]